MTSRGSFLDGFDNTIRFNIVDDIVRKYSQIDAKKSNGDVMGQSELHAEVSYMQKLNLFCDIIDTNESTNMTDIGLSLCSITMTSC